MAKLSFHKPKEIKTFKNLNNFEKNVDGPAAKTFKSLAKIKILKKAVKSKTK